jgi:hypothetical protein
MFRRCTQHGASLFMTLASSVPAVVYSENPPPPRPGYKLFNSSLQCSEMNYLRFCVSFPRNTCLRDAPTDRWSLNTARFTEDFSKRLIHYNMVMLPTVHCLKYWACLICRTNLQLDLSGWKHHVIASTYTDRRVR